MRKFLLLYFFIFAFSCLADDARVSIINLIATPEKFENQEVIVSGILRNEFESKGIYLNTEDYSNRNSKNGIWLISDKVEMPKSGTFVTIKGEFTSKKKGHLGAWSGTIKIKNVNTPIVKQK